DEKAFGDWSTPALKAIWSVLTGGAEASDKLHVVASCRYLHDDFGDAVIPVTLLPRDALYRMMDWFPALRRLSHLSRKNLTALLAGHPRAVEYTNDLVRDALAKWARTRGEWLLPDPPTLPDL